MTFRPLDGIKLVRSIRLRKNQADGWEGLISGQRRGTAGCFRQGSRRRSLGHDAWRPGRSLEQPCADDRRIAGWRWGDRGSGLGDLSGRQSHRCGRCPAAGCQQGECAGRCEGVRQGRRGGRRSSGCGAGSRLQRICVFRLAVCVDDFQAVPVHNPIHRAGIQVLIRSSSNAVSRSRDNRGIQPTVRPTRLLAALDLKTEGVQFGGRCPV